MKMNVEGMLTIDATDSALRLLDPMTQAFCRGKNISAETVNRLSFALEAVVTYCSKVIRDSHEDHLIQILFSSNESHLEILIEYGPDRGPIEPYFRHGCRDKRFKVTTFEALGLHIARELIESIEFSSAAFSENRFLLRIPLP
ncbi:MAG: hypothetical protein PHP44_14680 [Kiritimatiellae bacterium]|nr:hypothetical protein [Kiritimatiellia bacterium]MDD4737339.1 hypothetical protein [Kiritimatiellia bacterium]